MISSAAVAADLPPIAPPLRAPPVIVEEVGSGWYLRGDIGFSNQRVKKLDSPAFTDPAAGITGVVQEGLGFDAAPLGDIGLGFQLNNWLRFDATAQYRAAAHFNGSDNITGNGFVGVDNYTASKSEWLFLANAYVDLGTWWCVTPFVGAGIGMANVNITNFRDDGHLLVPGLVLNPATAYFADHSQWNFAWAFHAGLAYRITPSVTAEFAYHYVNLGDGATGTARNFDNSVIVPASTGMPHTFNSLTSQDFTLGLRWMFDTPPAPIPLMRRG